MSIYRDTHGKVCTDRLNAWRRGMTEAEVKILSGHSARGLVPANEIRRRLTQLHEMLSLSDEALADWLDREDAKFRRSMAAKETP